MLAQRVEGADLPVTFEVDVPEAGYLEVAVAEPPEAFNFWCLFPEAAGPVASEQGQARVAAGKQRITIKDRWNNDVEGAFDVVVHFTAEVDESEPNNRIEQARAVEMGEFTVRIFPEGEHDWLKLEAPGPGYLTCVAIEPPKGYTHWPRFYLDEKTHLGDNEIRVNQAGPIYMRLGDRWNRFSSLRPIRLRTMFHSETDASEPNDQPDTARTVKPGKLNLAIAPAGDTDQLRFELDQPGYVEVTAPQPPQGMNPWAEIYDALGNHRGANFARVDFPGEVRIAFRDRWNKFSSVEPFEIELTVHPETDLLEPNDTVAQAAVAPRTEWFNIVMAPKTDVDHFIVDVPAHGLLFPETPDAPDRLDWRLHDADGEVLQRGAPFPVAPGRHVISARPRFNMWWDFEPFPVRIRWAPGHDVLEPNDEKAAAIELDRVYPVRLDRPDDVDRLKVTLGRPGRVVFEALGEPPLQATFTHGSADAARSAMPLIVTVTEPGDVEVALQGVKQAYAEDLLLIRARYIGDPDPHEPNDELAQAAPIELNQPTMFQTWPAGDDEWFRFETDKPTNAIVEITSAVYDRPHWPDRAITIEFHNAAGERVSEVAIPGGDEGFVFPAFNLREPGQWYLHVKPKEVTTDPMVLHVHTTDARAASEADRAMYIIGLELDERRTATVKSIATEAGGEALETEKAADLPERFDEAVALAVKPKIEAPALNPTPKPESGAATNTSPWLWIAGGATLIVIVLGVAVTQRRRRA
ncbi:MAG: hypothetical protein ACODAQ_04645 [Phycisphaeraceae bacterium]